jgi:hypothetical protein
MEDYKGMFAVSLITKSDESFDRFMDARERLPKWIVGHAAVIDEVITERKYNRMLNEEVR